jgi:hypothetical protein
MPNRLASANSLYLRKHAENPIDWWWWCDEALATARKQDKPIFLSVGYSSCHWCTVMEGEAFSDSAIADYLNAYFLPIKVDREERPDLDSIYMQAVQMMIGQGGWPLNVFLTPDDLVPFYGGTYFPIEPRYGRPGFLQVLQSIRHYYDTEKEKLAGIKAEILGKLQTSAQLQPISGLEPSLLEKGLEYNTGVVLAKAPGPSFPMMPYAEVALRSRRLSFESRYDAKAASIERGLDLALGGIFDHVGGGFHRYTVDPNWTVPHFEKMLYDNGQIMEYLANLWAAGVQEPAVARAIDYTATWLQREMTAPTGFFYAAQDADSFVNSAAVEPEEGAFYVWDYSELIAALTSEELAELAAAFTVSETGNFEGHNVLKRSQRGALSNSLEAILDKLFVIRYGASRAELAIFSPAIDNRQAKTIPWAGRIPAVTDTKLIVAWNSLMISGLVRAAAVFQRSDYWQQAVTAAQFILDQQWISDRFHRVNYDEKPSILAQSEDYALFIKALLDLHQVALMFAPMTSCDWLTQATRVQAEMDQHLWSQDLGGYFNTDAQTDLIVRERSYVDNATPAANGVAAANLVRLGLLTDDLAYLDRAEQTLNAFGSIMVRSPQACPSLFSALDWFQYPVLVRTSSELIAQLIPRYFPTTVFKLEPTVPSSAVGLVCRGLSCLEPASSLEHLLEQLYRSQGGQEQREELAGFMP